MPTTAVSVILPVFNEADNLEPLAKDAVSYTHLRAHETVLDVV